MKIGEVAQQAGVAVDTVRFYERRGVLPSAARKASGYRVFTPATVERIRFAKTLQALGFTLDEILEILRAVDAGAADCASEQRHFDVVLARVDEKIATLRKMRRRLARTLQRCRDGSCTLLDGVSVTNAARELGLTPSARSCADCGCAERGCCS